MQWQAWDLFPKALPELQSIQKRTCSGGLVTIVAMALGVVLFVSELGRYLSVETNHTVSVDNTIGDGTMSITVDIDFFSVPCEHLDMHIQDAKGVHVQSVRDDVTFTPFDPSKQRSKGLWGRMWSKSKLADQLQGTNQAPAASDSTTTQGCSVRGSVHADKVTGILHVTAYKLEGGHGMLVLQPEEMDHMMHVNTSHRINYFGFGKPFPGQEFPLSDATSITRDLGTQFQFFVNLVPTRWRSSRGRTIDTHQYSVTEFVQEPSKQAVHYLPGLAIKYEFAPMRIDIIESSPSFLQFLSSLCAIVGGLMTVAGLLNSGLYQSQKLISKAD
jgi:hypothetical protein